MKKIKILSFASLPLAMALLAGCGHQHSFSEEWTSNAEKHWHDATCEHKDQRSEEGSHVFGDDNICDVCGYDKGGEPGPGPEVDHTVTSEEWIAAWDTSKPYYIADNYKASMKLTVDGADGFQRSDMTVDGNKVMLEAFVDSEKSMHTDYAEKLVSGKFNYYSYDSKADKYFYEVTSENPADDFAMQLQSFTSMTGFNYDEASQSYKKESGSNPVFGNITDLVIQFGAKKVTSFSFKFNIPTRGAAVPATMNGTFTYGGQEVELPEAEPAPVHEHNYSIQNHDETHHWMECSCGKIQYGIKEQHYDDNEDGYCDICYYEMGEKPVPGKALYGYKINDGLYSEMSYEDKNGQWEVYDLSMSAGDTITFANISSSLQEPAILSTLYCDGEDQGFNIDEGVLTATVEGIYSFIISPEETADRITIEKQFSPTPTDVCELMSSSDSWTTGSEMSLKFGSETEYVIENVTVEAAQLINVRFNNNYISSFKNTGGENNAFDIGVCVVDGNDARFELKSVVNVYFESDTSGDYGIFVELKEVVSPYRGVIYVDDSPVGFSSFKFNKIEGQITEYALLNAPADSGMEYEIQLDESAIPFSLENGGESVNFTPSGNRIVYSGSASFLNFYLKVSYDGPNVNYVLYVEDANPKSNFQMLVGSNAVNLTLNPYPMEGFTEYFIEGISIAEGDIIRFIDNTQNPAVTFDVTKIDEASVPGFVVDNGSIKCTTAGTYNVYLKLQMGSDQIYFEK